MSWTAEEIEAAKREVLRVVQAKRIKARRRKLGQNGFVASGRSAIPGKRPFRRTRNSA